MTSSLLWITPLVPVLIALGMLLVRDRRLLAALDIGGSVAVLALTLAIAHHVAEAGAMSAAGVFRADELAVLFLLLICLLAVATSVATVGWMRQEIDRGRMRKDRLQYYYALVQGFIATMLVTVLADNLGILWIAMEGTTITSAVLVGFHGDKLGLEAAWKYIIVTTIGISFGLFGTVLIYGAAVHAQHGVVAGAMNWSSIAAIAHSLDPGIVRIGFIFVLVGYGTKAGLAPVHMWLPDAHSQAPTPVSAMLSGALIKCALFGIIRFHIISQQRLRPRVQSTAAAHLRPVIGGRGDAVYHRPTRPQAAARLSQCRARRDHHAGAGFWREVGDIRGAAARHQPRSDQGPGVPGRRRRDPPLRYP